MLIRDGSYSECQRLNALAQYQIMDTVADENFDRLTSLAARICQAPIALMSLVDSERQWFKSKTGLNASETCREYAFCAHAIQQCDLFIVPDARLDSRFSDNPLVTGAPHVVFYAGAPLIDPNGFALGTLCVIDHVPRELSEDQKFSLRSLADQIVLLMVGQQRAVRAQEAKDFLFKISQQIPGVIYQYQEFPDGRSCFPYMSDAMSSNYGINPEDAQKDATPIFQKIHPDDLSHVAETISESQQNLGTWVCEYRVNLPKLGTRWVRGNTQPDRLTDGSTIWHGFISDITEEKERESLLSHQSKLLTLGEMAGGIAHEINNPLALISAKVGLLRKDLTHSNFNCEHALLALDKIDLTVARIGKIIRGLKSISRKADQDPMVIVPIDVPVQDAIELCQEKFRDSGVALQVHFAESFDLECRPTQISQVVMNLLSNALDAVRGLSDAWVKIHVSKCDGDLKISVSDSGPPISQAVADKIMSPFFTTKPLGKGTGLGLSISKGLIVDHGGQLRLDRAATQTTFVIQMPLCQPVRPALKAV